MGEGNAGQMFLRKLLNHQRNGEFSVDLVGAVANIEDRFLDDGEKQTCMTILKSLAKGQTVNVTKQIQGNSISAPSTGSKDQKLNPMDKDAIKQINDIL